VVCGAKLIIISSDEPLMPATEARNSEIGRRVRVQRLARGLSQGELGKHLGVSFQQIQKYENGRNRVGSGRLQRVAEVLSVPITFFFSDNEKAAPTVPGDGSSPFDLWPCSGRSNAARASHMAEGQHALRIFLGIFRLSPSCHPHA